MSNYNVEFRVVLNQPPGSMYIRIKKVSLNVDDTMFIYRFPVNQRLNVDDVRIALTPQTVDEPYDKSRGLIYLRFKSSMLYAYIPKSTLMSMLPNRTYHINPNITSNATQYTVSLLQTTTDFNYSCYIGEVLETRTRIDPATAFKFFY